MADSKEFLEYLQNSGGQDATLCVLIEMDSMREKPENPVEYLRENIDREITNLHVNLKAEIEKAKEVISEIEEQYPQIYDKHMKRKMKTSAKRKTKKS